MNAISRISIVALAAFAAATVTASTVAAQRTSTVSIVETTDVHGAFFPEDFITRRPAPGSLARVTTYVDSLRAAAGADNMLLLDNGDMLQGQPTVYYYNYYDTVSPHIAADITRFMGYDAQTIGNHDVETGHPVYDRWRAQTAHPVLGANVIDAATGLPYLQPYAMFTRDSLRIAVLGLLTPAIPGWLPESLWEGLRFDDMQSAARRWVDHIKSTERPDLIVGLFHAGRDSTKTVGEIAENASLQVARHVPGFDIVLIGHDHSPFSATIVNDYGHPVTVLNPANEARKVAQADICYTVNADGSITVDSIVGRLVDVTHLAPSQRFLEAFTPQHDTVAAYVGRNVGTIADRLDMADAYFGPSAFIDLIHTIQLDIADADISFASPLSFDTTIDAGALTVAEMFKLYKYENMLYTMLLTGREVKDYLEMSYDMWTRTVTDPADGLLRLRDADATAGASDMTHVGFIYPSYNFDSAAGIIYTVDITKPHGEKIDIISMADGSPFSLDNTYKVAINSYHGNGGGNLITKGAGIAPADIPSRIAASTDRDVRYYIIDYIERRGTIDPRPLYQWKFIPEKIAEEAATTSRDRLFNK